MKITGKALRLGTLPALLLVFAMWGTKTPAHNVKAAAPAHPSTAIVEAHLDGDDNDDNCSRFRRSRDDDDDSNGRGDESRNQAGV